MIDNLTKVLPILTFTDNELFYHVLLIKRRKDPGNEEMETNSRIIKHWTIGNEDHLLDEYPLMKTLSEATNSRLCVFLNRRNWEAVAIGAMQHLFTYITRKNYKQAKRAYFKSIGNCRAERKWFILDFDGETAEKDAVFMKDYFFEKFGKPNNEGTAREWNSFLVPSRTGVHLIIPPQNYASSEYSLPGFPEFDIQKDAYTNLYIPNYDKD